MSIRLPERIIQWTVGCELQTSVRRGKTHCNPANTSVVRGDAADAAERTRCADASNDQKRSALAPLVTNSSGDKDDDDEEDAASASAKNEMAVMRSLTRASATHEGSVAATPPAPFKAGIGAGAMASVASGESDEGDA